MAAAPTGLLSTPDRARDDARRTQALVLVQQAAYNPADILHRISTLCGSSCVRARLLHAHD